jgi:tRNA A37 threonylcarbamoyladenosine biosynthesis protein TsaE
MEWPECIEPLLPDDTVKITITVIDENTRRITM